MSDETEAGAIKLVYVKRWRTIVKLPAKYADEIVEALRAPAQGAQERIALISEHLARFHRNSCYPNAEATELYQAAATLDAALRAAAFSSTESGGGGPETEVNEVNDAWARGEHIPGVTR